MLALDAGSITNGGHEMDKILVGLDASPRASHVLDTAVNLARKTGGKLILFRAVGIPIGLPAEAYAMSPDSLEELLEREAKRYLETAAASVPRGTASSP